MEKVDKKRVTKVSIYQNLSNDQQYKASTGLTISEFSTLFLALTRFLT